MTKLEYLEMLKEEKEAAMRGLKYMSNEDDPRYIAQRKIYKEDVLEYEEKIKRLKDSGLANEDVGDGEWEETI